MKKLSTAFALSISLVTLHSQSAIAGDRQWQGLYGGFATTLTGAPDRKDDFGPKLKKKIGAGAGFVLGYNYVSDNFLFGLEGDILATSMELKSNTVGLSKSVDINSMSSLRVRAGMLFGDELDYLLYATGGLAVTNVETAITTVAGTATDDRYVTGFAVGAGVETWLFGNDWVSTKLEYLYANVPAKNYASGFATPYRFKAGIHQIRSSWNVHF